MKKLRVFVLFLAACLICIGSSAAGFAQPADDAVAIRVVVIKFYDSSGKGDFITALDQMSPDFYMLMDGEEVDYRKFELYMKETIERRLETVFERFNDNITVTRLDISGNSAVAEVEYDLKWRSMETLEEMLIHHHRRVLLDKKGETWKIVSIERMTVP